MATSTVRSVVIFSVIAIGFIGLSAGGMFFLKSRNHTLATVNTQQGPQKQNQNSPDQTKKDVAKTDNNKNSSNTGGQDKKTDTKPSTAVSQPSASTPAPAPDNKKAEDKAAATATPTTVPATGPSLPSMMATLVLMMASAFFGGQLLRARNAYRRHLEG